MKKFLIFVLLIVIAMISAGFYGIIHDQISYTISHEYFTKFKFPQFGVAEMNLPNRARVAIVGFLASWWMGIPIGFLVGVVGFIHRGHWRMFKISLCSFMVVIAFTFLFGFCGLLYGVFQTRSINLADYQSWFIPPNVIHLRRFLCVGYMHNSAYLGGVLAIFVGWIFQIVARIKNKNSFA